MLASLRRLSLQLTRKFLIQFSFSYPQHKAVGFLVKDLVKIFDTLVIDNTL